MKINTPGTTTGIGSCYTYYTGGKCMKTSKVLLALSMILSMSLHPMTVFAEENGPEDSGNTEIVEEVLEETEETAEEAVEETPEEIVEEVPEETAEETPEAPAEDTEPITYYSGIEINPVYKDVIKPEDIQKKEIGEDAVLLNASRNCASVNEAAVWMRGQLKNRTSSLSITVPINLSTYGDDLHTGASTVFKQILDGAYTHTKTPTEGDYIRWHVHYWEYSATYYPPRYSDASMRNKITYDVTLDLNSTASMEKTTTTYVNDILNAIPAKKTASDYDKAYQIFKWITGNVVYTDASDYETNMYYHNCYSAAVDKSTTCQGFSLLFYRLALSLGLDVRLIAGDGSTSGKAPHGWNIVKIDGKWYNVDSTWDSEVSPSSWRYFLKAASPFKDNHRPYEDYTSSSFKSKYPVATSDYTSTASYAKLDKIKEFVKRLYTECMGRTADTGGLLQWSGYLHTKARTAASVVKSFYHSTEFQNKNLSNSKFVDNCYKVMMNRKADAGGKANWVSILKENKGLITRDYVLKGFVGSKEFTNICDSYGVTKGTFAVSEARDRNLGCTQFVARLYREAMEREPDTGGLNTWCAKILDKKQTAQSVAVNSFICSTEFKNKHYSNSVFVDKMYTIFLNRDADTGGKNNWMKKLASGTSRKAVAEGFANSQEFSDLLKSYGIK